MSFASGVTNVTNRTGVSGVSMKTDMTTYSNVTSVYSENLNAVEEEASEEEDETYVCGRETIPVIKDPTPKQILGMFRWNGQSLYDHLKELLEKLISTRPDNVMEYFDQYSREIRFKKPPVNPLVFLPTAVKLSKLYGLIFPTSDEDGVLRPKIVNPFDYICYFEEMGVCLPRVELYQIALALEKLSLIEGFSQIRFWGKIFGLERSYIVAECELTHDEMERRLSMEREEMYGEEEEMEEEEESIDLGEPLGLTDIFTKEKSDSLDDDEDIDERIVYKKLDKYEKPPLPRPIKPTVEKMVPEKTGEGPNKKVYYVCHDPGDEWIPLPNVKPENIIAARKIRKYLKGYLLSKVDTYPPFKGTEKELLRAQIARISAGTQISPLGFYQFGGGAEEGFMAGEEPADGEIVANLDYDAVPPQDLLKPEFWVHHTPHILKIGRTTYWHEPQKISEEEVEEEFQLEDKNKEEKKDEELGPPILTPISEDISQEMIAPWTIKISSMLLPGSGIVTVRSNLWPGAHAFAKGRGFENIYLGWGLKLCVGGFNPTYLPKLQKEYEIGPEIMEMTDPTPEMEDEWREAHKPPPIPIISPEEEGEGEEGDFGEEVEEKE